MQYNPQMLIVQHLHIKEKGKNIEINRMKRSYFVVVMTFVKFGGNVVEVHEGLIYGEIFKISPFRNIIWKLFNLRKKCKYKNDEVLQLFVKLLKSSLYWEQMKNCIEEKYDCKSE